MDAGFLILCLCSFVFFFFWCVGGAAVFAFAVFIFRNFCYLMGCISLDVNVQIRDDVELEQERVGGFV